MRIGYFTSIEGWGGSEVYLLSLMRGVRALGHEPVLFGVAGARLYAEALQDGIRCVAWKHLAPVPTPLAGAWRDTAMKSPKGSWKAWILNVLPVWVKLLLGSASEVCRLRARFAADPVEVMHVNVHGYELAGVAGRISGVPCIAVYHISPVPEPYWFRRWLMRFSAKFYRRSCFVSRFSRDAWIQQAGIDRAESLVVMNGIDLSAYASVESPAARRPQDPFRALAIGRLHPMKGFRYLIEAAAYLKDRRLSIDIVGSGEEEGLLRALAISLGVDGQVLFRGHTEEPVQYMKHSDCVVLPSVSHEACPLTLLEAMACGRPMVTSDFGPLPEVNQRGVTGLVVPARDGRALAEALRTLMDSPQLATGMGLQARELSATFSRDRMIADMLSLYVHTPECGRKDS
jgi:glycosyltransferase involved in cell wall biosynthesis